jgi:O-antigen ligase
MWLLLLMIAIMPYEQSPYLQIAENLFGVFAGFTVIKAVGLLGFAWAGLRIISGDAMTYRLAARQATLFFVFLVTVSVLGLLHGSGFQYVIGRYIAYAVFLPFLVVAVRSQEDLRRVLTWLVWSYVAMFPYALRQMIRYDERLGVGIYEANYLATILVLLVPLAFAFASLQREPNRRWLWIGAGLTLVVMIVLTGSRGGFEGLVPAGVLFVYRRRGLGAAAGVLLALVIGVLAVPSELSTRALATISGDTSQLPAELSASNRAHVGLFWAALRMIGESPVIGVGPENFRDLSRLYTGLPQANIAHNMFLEIGAETGLIALLLFVLVLVSAFRAFSGTVRLAAPGTRLHGDPDATALAVWSEGLRSGLTGYVVAGCFISAQFEKVLWISIFLSIVVADLARRHRAAAAAEAEAETAPVDELGGALPQPS